jgi:hypothetical protein
MNLGTLSCLGALILIPFSQSSCSRTARTEKYIEHSCMLPAGLESGEDAWNVVLKIEGRTPTTRFYGADFLYEAYNSLPLRERISYAIYYGSAYSLDGEHSSYYYLATEGDRKHIQEKLAAMRQSDWRALAALGSTSVLVVKRRLSYLFGV